MFEIIVDLIWSGIANNQNNSKVYNWEQDVHVQMSKISLITSFTFENF